MDDTLDTTEDCVNIAIRKYGYEDSKNALIAHDNTYCKFFERFGVIFHWGIYSIFAYNPPRAKSSTFIHNGSEWYWSRYKKPFTYGTKTKDYHKEHFDDKNYYEFIDEFELRSINVDFSAWARLLKSKGVNYVIITSKHHDGVALYPSDYGLYKTKRDYVGELAKAVRSEGMKFGVYYSLLEITEAYGNGRSAKKVSKYVDEIMIPQLKELVNRYDVDMIWSDGDWQQTVDVWRSYEFLDWLFKESKVRNKIIVNDRWGKEFQPKPFYNIRYNFSDRYMPSETENDEYKMLKRWEHINTISRSWGYASNQTPKDYKSAKEINILKRKVLNLAGYFLLNFGPDSYGNLDKKEVEVFQDL
jgi:alpha-L-fucosidase